ncbi:hypothetical protein GA0070607_6116 [Micromonospora coriariae]|uniref:Uncharacterized protein n=1 Tax=Micromonospora coriariae TaxID=285665 RepID=A0A1C4Y1X8_9ACTN|nr:hypothetical protein [Micromonospora coriariae]SCF14708.1 hypothetical protein GA0070607_6116 [Micromonospora coriariae]
MAAVGNGTDHQPEPEAEPEPTGEVATGRGWPTGTRVLLAAAAVVLILGATAVAVIIADPHRLGMSYSSAPDGTRPDRTRPDGTPPDHVRPGSVHPDAGRPDGARSDADPETGAVDPDRPGGGTGGEGAAAAGQAVTAPLAGRQRATFVLADGLSLLELRVVDLGDDLYRISSPADSGVTARPAVLGETVRLGVVTTGASGARAVRVLLNERVSWRFQLVGGVSSQVLDLTRARLLGLELAGGSARTELLPPAVSGTTTVRLTGGTSQLDVRVPGEPPVRVRAGAGAASVVLRGERWVGVAAGALVGTPGWDRSADRLYLDLVAGVSSVTVGASTR